MIPNSIGPEPRSSNLCAPAKRSGKKILRHLGVAHNDGEIEVFKPSTRQLTEQLRADQTPRMELFPPPNMPIFKKLFAKPHVLKNWTLILVIAARRRACRLGSAM